MEIIYYSAIILLALLASVLVVLGLGGGLHFERLFGRHVVPLIPVFIVLAIGISTMLSGRNVSFYGVFGEGVVSSNPMGHWILRLATAMVVCASVVVSLSAIMRKDLGKGSGGLLFAAFAAYFASSYIISGVLGSKPSFVHNNFYALIIFFAAYVTRNQSVERFICWSRDGLNVFICMGVLAAAILPQIALQEGYAGMFPGITFRYWGVASHANALGPIAVIFLLLLRWKPYRWWGLNLLTATAALISLLLSQSKTAWIAGAAALVVLLGYHAIYTVRDVKKGKHVPLVQFAWIFTPFILALSLLVVISIGSELGTGTHLQARFGNQVSTFTGRDTIWSVTLRQWEQNPLFGYGPRLWSNEFAAREGYLMASNAHNQFVDVLGSSGLLGLLCFSVYLLLLLRYAWSSVDSTKGVSLALVGFFLLRCITEVPLKTANVTTPDFLMHFILFNVLLRARFTSLVPEVPTYALKRRRRLAQTSFSS